MILVTGASGNVGSSLVHVLRERGAPFRVGARKAGSVAGGASAAGGEVAFDFQDPATFRPAARGCEAVFVLRPPAISDTSSTLIPFIDAARSVGVRHVVFLSVAGAADNPIVPHHAVEQHLLKGLRGWTILRPGFFAQNLGDAYREDIAREGRILVPAGAGRAAFIDVRDVAEVAANVLVDPAPHDGQSYTLTGPAAVAFTDVAAILSDELGRAIRYDAASVRAYLAHLRGRGMPFAQVLVQTVLHVGLRFGQAETVDPTLPRLLGHDARTLRDYVRDHRALWDVRPAT